jgi:hypothetical protein
MPTAKVHKLSQTAELRRLNGSAFKPHEIALRLATLARRLEAKADKGKGLEVGDVRFLASKLRVYARRLARRPQSITPSSSSELY